MTYSCGSASPTVAVYQQKAQESSSSIHQGWMSQLVFSISQNPEEIGSSAHEGMDLLVRVSESKQAKSKLPAFLFFI